MQSDPRETPTVQDAPELDLGLITRQAPIATIPIPETHEEAREHVLCAFEDFSYWFRKVESRRLAKSDRTDRMDCLMFALAHIFPDILKYIFGNIHIIFNSFESDKGFDVRMGAPPTMPYMTIEDAFIEMINKCKIAAGFNLGVARWLWKLYYSMGDRIQSNIWYNRYHQINTLFKNKPGIPPSGITCINNIYMHDEDVVNFLMNVNNSYFFHYLIGITGYVTIDILNMILSINFRHELGQLTLEYINNPDSNIDHLRITILPKLRTIRDLDISKVKLDRKSIVSFVKTTVQLKLDGELKHLHTLSIPFHPDASSEVYKYIKYVAEKKINLSIVIFDWFHRIPREPTK